MPGTNVSFDPRNLPHYRWIILAGLMICGWPVIWYSFAMGIILPSMSDDLGMSSSQQGWLGSSYFLASFLLTIPLTHWMSHMRPSRMLAGVLIASTALIFAAAALPNYGAQFAARFLVAAAFVGVNPARTLITQSFFAPKDYALANGVANATYGVMEPIAFWSTAPLISILGGWQGLFVFLGAFSIFWTVLWLLFAREPRPGQSLAPPAQAHQDARSPLGVLRRRELWWAAVAVLGSSMSWAAVITFWPTFGQDTLGLTEDQTGFVLGFTSLAIVPFALSAPLLLRRLGRRVPLMVVSNLLQIPAFGLMLVTDNVALLALITAAQGVGALSYTLLLTAPFHLHDISPREVAAATAFILVMNQGGLAIGPAAVGMIAEFSSLGLGLAIFAFMPLVSVVGCLLLGEAEEPPPATPIEAADAAAMP